MKRFPTGLVYHKIPSRAVICALCAAAWEERFVGVSRFNSDGRKTDGQSHLCPRCLPPSLTVDFVMEQEIELAALEPDADPVEVRRAVAARYATFLRGSS